MAKLKEVLQHKNKGDEWFSYLAPEEYHTWKLKSPWDFKQFRNYDVSLLGISVFASEDVKGTKNLQRFSRQQPHYLERTGIEIVEGHMGTKVKRVGSAKFRVDSIIELNEAMKELSEDNNIGFWWVVSIEISNNKTGGICQFQRHNPDGHGVNLFFYRLTLDKSSRLYPDISLNEQEQYIGKFHQHFARCICVEKKTKFHGCAIDKSARKIIKEK